MTTISFAPWRHGTAEIAFWNLFAWFGRACDQAAGVLLNPLIVAVFALAVERDPFRLAWFVTGYGWGWLIGSAVTPFLQQVTVRVMPWIVGGYIVRVAAVVLLTYAVTDGGSTQDQRFVSMLICYVTYAIATGMARTAQARHLTNGAPGRLWDVHQPLTNFGLAAVLAIAAFAAWSALDRAALSWSSSFGRIFMLAAMALGVACLAAIREGVDNPELPPTGSRSGSGGSVQRRVPSSNSLVSMGVAAITLIEVLAFAHLFTEFRRQTILIRGGIAFFAIGWTAGILFWGLLRGRLLPSLLAQITIGIGAAGIIVCLATPNLARADWFPDSLGEQSTSSLLIYVTGLLIGLGMSGRRLTMSDSYDIPTSAPNWMGLATGVVAGLVPLLVGLGAREVAREWVLISGLILTLFVLAAIGMLPAHADPKFATRGQQAPVRQVLLPRQ